MAVTCDHHDWPLEGPWHVGPADPEGLEGGLRVWCNAQGEPAAGPRREGWVVPTLFAPATYAGMAAAGDLLVAIGPHPVPVGWTLVQTVGDYAIAWHRSAGGADGVPFGWRLVVWANASIVLAPVPADVPA